jgi:hypothetical protein
MKFIFIISILGQIGAVDVDLINILLQGDPKEVL